MRRETGNSEKKKKRWRLTPAARQDLYVLEDLQMILSFVNDADEQFVEDVMLKKAEPFEVKQITSVLQGLSSSCEERESSLGFKTRTEGGENAS